MAATKSRTRFFSLLALSLLPSFSLLFVFLLSSYFATKGASPSCQQIPCLFVVLVPHLTLLHLTTTNPPYLLSPLRSLTSVRHPQCRFKSVCLRFLPRIRPTRLPHALPWRSLLQRSSTKCWLSSWNPSRDGSSTQEHVKV